MLTETPTSAAVAVLWSANATSAQPRYFVEEFIGSF